MYPMKHVTGQLISKVKKMKYLLICIMAFQVNAFAFKTLEEELKEVRVSERGYRPRDHVIDPYKQERQKVRRSYSKQCRGKKFEKFYQYEECSDNAHEKWSADYPNRGSNEYGDKFYSKLSPAQAKAKRDELVKLMDTVSFAPRYKDREIELVVDDLHYEVMYIERYVLKVNPRDYRPFK